MGDRRKVRPILGGDSQIATQRTARHAIIAHRISKQASKLLP